MSVVILPRNRISPWADKLWVRYVRFAPVVRNSPWDARRNRSWDALSRVRIKVLSVSRSRHFVWCLRLMRREFENSVKEPQDLLYWIRKVWKNQPQWWHPWKRWELRVLATSIKSLPIRHPKVVWSSVHFNLIKIRSKHFFGTTQVPFAKLRSDSSRCFFVVVSSIRSHVRSVWSHFKLMRVRRFDRSHSHFSFRNTWNDPILSALLLWRVSPDAFTSNVESSHIIEFEKMIRYLVIFTYISCERIQDLRQDFSESWQTHSTIVSIDRTCTLCFKLQSWKKLWWQMSFVLSCFVFCFFDS